MDIIETIKMDQMLFEYLEYNAITTGLIFGLLATLFKKNRVIAYINDKLNIRNMQKGEKK